MSSINASVPDIPNAVLAGQQQQALRHRLHWNVISNYLFFAVNLGLGLYLVPYLYHHLGAERFGAWSLIGSIMMYLGMVDLGFGSSVQKYVAEFAAAGEEDRINRLLSTGIVLFCGCGLLAVIVSLLVVPLLGPVLKLSAANVGEARLALLLSAFVQALGLPLGVVAGALNGLQRMDINNAIGAIGSIGNTILVIAAVHAGFGLPGICVAYLIVSIIAAIVRYRFLKRVLPKVRLLPNLFDRSIARSTSAYGFTFSGMKLAHFVKYYTDSFVIAGFLSTAAVTPFAIANKLASMIRQLVEQAVEVLIPVFSLLDRLDDQETIRKVYMHAGKITVGIGAPLTLLLCMFAQPVLKIWLGEAPRQTVVLTNILAITVFASIVPLVSVKLLLGVANHKTLMIATLIDSAANLVLSIVLVKSYGLIGVAIGTMAPLLISHLFVFPWLGCRHLGMSTVGFLYTLVMASGVPLIPAGLLAYGFLYFLPPPGVLSLVGEGAMVAVVYAVAFFVVSLNSEERAFYRTRFGKVLRAA